MFVSILKFFGNADELMSSYEPLWCLDFMQISGKSLEPFGEKPFQWGTNTIKMAVTMCVIAMAATMHYCN
jgi:hypothetical protein